MNENLKADFKDWLTHPLTKVFVKILAAQRNMYLKVAQDTTYKSYYKKEINDQSTLLFGKADGIDTVLDLLQSCKESSESIDQLFQQTFEKND